MSNWRVVRYVFMGEEYRYKIEDIYIGGLSDVQPFVDHGSTGACSIDDLRKELREKLKALDKPVLHLMPETLVEVKPEGGE
jgi:hypothetical protein